MALLEGDRPALAYGAASPEARLMILNPSLLGRYTRVVQLFVFHHECGHHHVGESELGADCWAVGQGVREGWLDRNGLTQVCRSFENAPETDTHPSGQRRCSNIDKCFAKAEVEHAKAAPAKAAAAQTLAANPAARAEALAMATDFLPAEDEALACAEAGEAPEGEIGQNAPWWR